MTTNYRRDWHNISDVYYKQAYHDPHSERSPSSAIETINHFSKKHTVRRYKNPEGYFDDGFPKSGEYELIDIWGLIRTVWAGKKEESYDSYEPSGVSTKGVMVLYYNPYNINHPPEGIHLHLTNPRNQETTDYKGFADIIEYNSLLWKVIEHNSYDTSYGSDGKEYMGKATIVRYKNNPVNDSTYDTTNINNNKNYKLR